MFQFASRTGVNAAQPSRIAALYELNARLALRFEASGAQTKMRVDVQEPPWRVIRAFPLVGGGALVHIHNVSGGVLAGDHLSLDIAVGKGASAQITTTGATRLYRHRKDARRSEQHVCVSVASGGLLEYLPDPVIPYAGSNHLQRTLVSLEDSATLFWWECLAPGRQAMGEEFSFESLRVETRLQSERRPIALEEYQLEPLRKPMRTNARLGQYSYVASFYAIQVGRSAAELRALEMEMAEVAEAASSPGTTIWGASALASDGVVVRGLSATARDLPATLTRFWTTARRFLTGEEAVPPRKLK